MKKIRYVWSYFSWIVLLVRVFYCPMSVGVTWLLSESVSDCTVYKVHITEKTLWIGGWGGQLCIFLSSTFFLLSGYSRFSLVFIYLVQASQRNECRNLTYHLVLRRWCKMLSSKKLTCKGTLRQVFIYLRPRTPYPPSYHTVYVYEAYLFTQGMGGGGGGRWNREKVRGATVHRARSKNTNMIDCISSL